MSACPLVSLSVDKSIARIILKIRSGGLRVETSRQHPLDISDVLARASLGERTDEARALIQRAYTSAERAHAGQTRKSGDPYIQHPLAVAFLLADLGMDPDTIAAGLLHDVVEDSDTSLDMLQQEFGPSVASLVDGVTKLEQIEQEQMGRFSQEGERPRGEQESESLRKMFFAMAEDIRVVIIKLADRLHNMRTLDSLAPERRKTIAHETLEIFAPLANRLGVWQWKWELEDLSLRHLEPEAYAEIASFINERRPQREAGIQRHIEVLQCQLAEEGIEAEITGRPKHIYSIYRKMQHKGIAFRRVYDVRGIRVITQSVPDCYRVLGIAHGLWRPIPGEFDDYIATPKENLYQSLHTAVVGDDGNALEVQIRSWEMHRIAEYGIAAHWRYKEGRAKDRTFEAKIAWLRSLIELRKEATDADEFVDAMKTDIFRDRVYTFTPKGKLIDLPVGATPIDFAYQVHTEIGHHCRGARVNGRLVSLETQLKNGDQVEILTTRRGGPSRDWLNPALGTIKTSRARNKIRQWFRRQDREQNIAQGRDIIERELKRLGLEKLSHDSVARLFNYEKLADFHAAVGSGDIHIQQIVSKIAEMRPREEAEEERLAFTPPLLEPTVEGIQVQGTGGLLTRLAYCCRPLPGDDIVGYVTRGRGVSVHRRDCPNILRLSDTERLIEVSWGAPPQTVPTAIQVTAYDRPRLISEISNIIGAEDINISAISQDVRKNIATLYITIHVNNMAQLSRVLIKIARLPNVIEAHRHTG